MILIVGNILKDVYLNLDPRVEPFETDKNGTKWLDLGFDASSHYYFCRKSAFGGAAISLEVFNKLGIQAKINGSDFSIDDDDSPKASVLVSDYRYVLVSEDNVSYLAPTVPRNTTFPAPTETPNCIYVDRSAHLTEPSVKELISYLEAHKNTKFILYCKDASAPELVPLISLADLVITEDTSAELNYNRTILISDHDLSYKNIIEPFFTERIDKFTHLSTYSIAAATILSGFILGETVENSLKMARLNIEYSTLDSTLSLNELNTLKNSDHGESLELVAATLMAPQKGILAADESGGSIKKKFAALGIEDTPKNRHDYRNIFFTTNDIEAYLNGVILFDETARDTMENGTPIPDFLTSHCIMPGIKVDQGLEHFPNSPDETYTKGLDGLEKRLREYREMGLRFAKWRAAFNSHPSELAISENCRILAHYAKSCQSAGIVPIVEPEVVYDGDYSIEENAAATSKILDQLINELRNYDVTLSACIIKCNMVLAGKKYERQSTPNEVGRATAEVLKAHVPKEIGGVVFLSGGQSPEQATANLAAIVKNGPFPFPLTFSFARAIQDPALYAWAGNNDNIELAKKAFKERLERNTEVL